MSFKCWGLRPDSPTADPTGKDLNAMSTWISLAWNGRLSSSGKTSRSSGLGGYFSLSLLKISSDGSRAPLSELASRTAPFTSPSSSFSLTHFINCSTSVCWLELCLDYVRGFRSTRSRFCMNIVIRLFTWVASDCLWLFPPLNGACRHRVGKTKRRSQAIFESGESSIDMSVSLSAAATAILKAFGANLRIRRRLRICNLLQSRDFESHALSTQPSKLNNRQMPVKNKAATYANNLPMQFSKMAPMTNRFNFVSNNLE